MLHNCFGLVYQIFTSLFSTNKPANGGSANSHEFIMPRVDIGPPSSLHCCSGRSGVLIFGYLRDLRLDFFPTVLDTAQQLAFVVHWAGGICHCTQYSRERGLEGDGLFSSTAYNGIITNE